MQKRCDLYLSEPVKSDLLKPLRLFDQSFSIAEKNYVGYLHVNVGRVKLVAIVSALRNANVSCFSVPIEYRDIKNIEMEEALSVAMEYAREKGASVSTPPNVGTHVPPVIWSFNLIHGNNSDERAGGVVMVDRLDGHVWNYTEYEEYMYDFNNVM